MRGSEITICNAVIIVLQIRREPMTIRDITTAIERANLYEFDTSDPKRHSAVVGNEIRTHCEEVPRSRKYEPLFRQVDGDRYELIEDPHTESRSVNAKQPNSEPQETLNASDLAEPAQRQQTTTYRILRDTDKANRVKALHNYECQICGHTIHLPDGSRYAEAHHIRPLGKPHDGPDTMGNIVCVCPNHHAELDYGARPLSTKDLGTVPGHSIDEEYICYHNEVICRQASETCG